MGLETYIKPALHIMVMKKANTQSFAKPIKESIDENIRLWCQLLLFGR